MIDKVNRLFYDAQKILEGIGSSKKTGEEFNIFSILERDRAEVRHSRLLAELLNPKGSHGNSSIFLKKFISINNLISDINNAEIDEFCNNAKVETEQYHLAEGKQGYIDIIIETDKIAIVIENKIDGPDQSAQLSRYAESKKDKEKVIIYLTPNGREPSNDSLRSLKKEAIPIHCISYKDNIYKWIEGCIDDCQGDNVKAILNQYKALIEKITSSNTKRENMELSKLLIKDDNIEVAIKLVEALAYTKATIEMEFFKKLKESVYNDFKNLGFEIYKGNDWEWVSDEDEIDAIINIRRANSKTGDNKLNAIYFIKELPSENKFFLRFAVDNTYNLWLDCFLSKTDTNKKTKLPAEISKQDKWRKKIDKDCKECILLADGNSWAQVFFDENDIYTKKQDERNKIIEEIAKKAIDIVNGNDFKELLEELEIII